MLKSPRHWATALLMVFAFPLGEIYRPFSEVKISPWWDGSFSYMVSVQYYVNKVCDLILPIMQWAIIWMWVRRVLVLEIGAWVNIVYTFYDLFMFFVNHNRQYDYDFIYSCIGVIAFAIYVARCEIHRLGELKRTLVGRIEKINHHAV